MRPFVWAVILLVASSNYREVDSAKILYITFPGFSQVYPMVKASKILQAKYNHTVDFVLPQYMIKHSVIQKEKINIIEAKRLHEVNPLAKCEKTAEAYIKGTITIGQIIDMFACVCDAVLGDNNLMKNLRKRHYDLLITMPVFVGDCLNFLGYKLSIPIVHYGPVYDAFHYGIPTNPCVTPEIPFAPNGEAMSLMQKVINTVWFYVKAITFNNVYSSDLSTKYVPEKPYISMQELRNQVQFVLFDFDVLLDYPRPSMPNTAFVGGLGTTPAEPLNKDIHTIMDTSTDGVVVVSFGTILKWLPDKSKTALFLAMKKIKIVKFVMKFGTENREDGNIIMRPWIPQNDLLGHKNTKAFITHCGNSGQYEALYHGIPMIGVPAFGDQFYNAGRMKTKGYGLVMELLDLEEVAFAEMIEEVLTNPVYKKNIYKASQIFKSRMGGSPSERFSYWIDHVIKNGGNYMQSASFTMPWYLYLGLDVIFIVTLILLMLFIGFDFICNYLKKCVSKREKVKTS